MSEKAVISIPVSKIKQVDNARLTYGREEMSELMASMKHRGLLSPIGVIPNGKAGAFEVVFGNRRFTAAKKLGWETIECLVLDSIEDDRDMLIVNAVENMQRADVPFAEQGRIFSELIAQGLSDKEIAIRIGVPTDRVRRILRIYEAVPAAMRNSVAKMTPGQRVKRGKVAASTAAIVSDMSSRIGLSKSKITEVMEFAAKDGITGAHARKLAGLVKHGMTVSQAIKEVDRTRMVTIQVALKESTIKELERRHKKGIHLIIYEFLREEKSLKIKGFSNGTT